MLSVIDLPAIEKFYLIAYPGNWFDRRMLETEKYFGYYLNNELVGISGVQKQDLRLLENMTNVT